ncbi:MAG: hypothetical protein P8124_04800 [Gammaproteobacteria bacterium]
MEYAQSYPTSGQQTAFGALRVTFGIIWLINAWFQIQSISLGHFLHWFAENHSGESPWLHAYIGWIFHGIQLTGTLPIEVTIAVVDILLALSLLTGLWLRFFGVVGILYGLFVWSTMGALGEPYSTGATDPGPGIVYAIAFLLITLAAPIDSQDTSPPGGADVAPSAHPGSALDRFTIGRILFGLLWAFDASWKWHPYFFSHFASYISHAEAGQPAWIMAYDQFVVHVINLIGPGICGLLVAILETLLAVSLLSGKWLRLFLPLGALFTLGIWTTAEGWGGPYSAGSTGMPGNLVGNAVLYCFIFAFFMVVYYPLYSERRPTESAQLSEA